MYSVKKSWKLSLMREYQTPPPNPRALSRVSVRKKLRSLRKQPFFLRGVGRGGSGVLLTGSAATESGAGGVRGTLSAGIVVEAAVSRDGGGGGVDGAVRVSDAGILESSGRVLLEA